jgi:hypothetical protein
MAIREGFKNIILTTAIFYGLIKFVILPSTKDFDFQISREHLKFHSNWT